MVEKLNDPESNADSESMEDAKALSDLSKRLRQELRGKLQGEIKEEKLDAAVGIGDRLHKIGDLRMQAEMRDSQKDTGQSTKQSFAAGGYHGNWEDQAVFFHEPFLTPPVVLLTAHNPSMNEQLKLAVAGMARAVTPNGFTLTARNSDSQGGEVDFFWVAFGCGLGCGG